MTLRRNALLLAIAAAALLGPAAAPAFGAGPGMGAEIKIPASPDRWLTDKAGFLLPTTVRVLDARLEDWERTSGHQFLVYIDRTSGGYPIEEYAVKAFQAWRVGRKGLDDGVVLFVMVDDKKIRIEVGYGLEDRITDLRASRIINDILVPGIQGGDPDGAVRRGIDAVQALVSVTSTAPASGLADAGASSAGRKGTLGKSETVLLVIGVIVFLIILITNPSFAIWLLINLLSGGRGGGGGGGGGFGGGGGRSGGGGASGGW